MNCTRAGVFELEIIFAEAASSMLSEIEVFYLVFINFLLIEFISQQELSYDQLLCSLLGDIRLP